MDVAIYTRVSTTDQKVNGFSLQEQERRLRRSFQGKPVDGILHYSDDASAKTFDRPGFQSLLSDIKSRKISIQEIWCTQHDRFSRNLRDSLNMLQELKMLGVSVRFLENDINPENNADLLFQVIHHVMPEMENQLRSDKTKKGMREAMRRGRWVFRAPVGYTTDPVSKLIHPNESAPFVQEAFKEVAKDILPMDHIRKSLMRSGFKCAKQTFYNMLRNPIYCGQIRIEAHRDEPEEIVTGLHEPLVPKELFDEVQHILSGNKKTASKRELSHLFPLRPMLNCPDCGRKWTGSSSRGRSNVYPYYHCTAECGQRVATSKVHDALDVLLDSIEVPKPVQALYERIVEDAAAKMKTTRATALAGLEKAKGQIERKQQRVEDDYLSNTIDAGSFQKINQRLSLELTSTKEKIAEVRANEDPVQEHLRFGLRLLANIKSAYQNSSVEVRSKLLGSMFPEKFIFDGQKLRTARPNKFVELMSSFSVGLKTMGNKKADISAGLSKMAPPLGLEPRTL